jgi:hypothetical protein
MFKRFAFGDFVFKRGTSETLFFRRSLVYFLLSVKERYNLTFDDKELIVMFISNDAVNESDSIQQFLEAENVSSISVEMYNSFRNSALGQFPELDSYKQLTSGLRTTMNAASNPKKKPDSNDGTTQEPEEDPDKKSGDTQEEPPKDDDSGAQPPAVPTEVTDPSSAPTTAEDGTSDPGVHEPEEPADPGSQADNEPAPDATPTEDVSATHTKVILPKYGDAKGVTLTLSQGESFDTALFRFEVEHFITAVLAKPPKSLSPSHAKLLERIKANWLYILSPQSLLELLKQVVRVPNRLTFN